MKMSVQSIKARSFIRYVLAILQLYCGYRCFDLVQAPFGDPTMTTIVIAGVALLPLLAGLGLIVHLQTGRILTLVTQSSQLIGFASPAFTWVASLGIWSRIQVSAIPSDIPGESTFRAEAHASLSDQAALAIGHPHPDYPGYVLSLNLLALAIMITAYFMFQKVDAGKAESMS